LFRMACSFSLRPAVRQRIYVSSPCGIETFFTSTSLRTCVQSSFGQFGFKLLHLAARRAHQILPTAFTNGRQILLAHNAPIKHPDPSRLAVLALYHAQNRLHGGDVSAVAVEGLVAERKAFAVDDERDHHLFAVGPVIARI